MIGNSVEFTYDPFFNLLRQASTPEGLTLNHSLDGRGNVTSGSVKNLSHIQKVCRKEMIGNSIEFAYDGFDRV